MTEPTSTFHGLNKEVVERLSAKKHDPVWMYNLRIKALFGVSLCVFGNLRKNLLQYLKTSV